MKQALRVAFYTLGCKVNQSDTATMEGMFRAAGHTVIMPEEAADVYVINTCVVTNVGQRKSRQVIHRLVREHPDALVVVTGCYPQTAAAEVGKIQGVGLIVGNQHRGQLVALVEAAKAGAGQVSVVDSITQMQAFEDLPIAALNSRTRAFLKIQEGCQQFCSYCIIPYARGPYRSRPLESIRREVQRLTDAGFQEIVLLGIHLGAYGRDLENVSLLDAVQTALSVSGFARLRLGSLESVEVEDGLLELMQRETRLCRHLHLPLQAADDTVLKRMNRPYKTADFSRLLEKIHQLAPQLAVTTDVIVGFPGETDEQFQQALATIEQWPLAGLHVFPYSPRKGTPAAGWPDQVPETVKKARAHALAVVDKRLKERFHRLLTGTTQRVLFETRTEDGLLEGLTDNYVRVLTPGGSEWLGRLANVEIQSANADFALGVLVE